jgi:hypothetical protein
MIRPLAALFLTLASCASAPPRVSLDAGWPQKAADYEDAHRAWTRRGSHSANWTLVVDAAATLKSPEWRAAYVRERARRQKLGAEAETRLAADERAAADKVWEVQLVMATAKPDWNDLRKGEQSMWRLALATDDGLEVLPTEVREDRRRREEIAAYFPDAKPFYSSYIVTFPKVTADGRPVGGKRLTLKIGGALGAVELVWASQ